MAELRATVPETLWLLVLPVLLVATRPVKINAFPPRIIIIIISSSIIIVMNIMVNMIMIITIMIIKVMTIKIMVMIIIFFIHTIPSLSAFRSDSHPHLHYRLDKELEPPDCKSVRYGKLSHSKPGYDLVVLGVTGPVFQKSMFLRSLMSKKLRPSFLESPPS